MHNTQTPALAERPKRRPYEAPRLTHVDLEAEEVLGKGCKVPGSPLFNRRLPNCGIGVCAAVGS